MANIKLKNRKGVDVSYENISQVSLPNSSGSGTTTFTDTSDANAAAADILASKTAYVNGTKLTGSIPTKTESDVTSTSGVVTIPAGYYASQVQKQGDPSGDATAVAGDILASKTAYSKGVKLTGTIPSPTITDADLNLSTYEATTGDYDAKATITIPKGYYEQTTLTKTLADIFPAPESEGTNDKVLSGYTLFDHSGKKIVGTMSNNTTGGTITSQGGTYNIPAGYTAGGTVTANINAGSATTPATTKQQSAPTFSKDGDVITASVAATSVSVTPTVSAGYVSSGTAGTVTMSANSATYTIPTQTKTATTNGTVSADDGKYLTSVSVSLPEYTGTILPSGIVGGKIFYVNTSSTGATYKFYDADGNELTNQTVDGLANAVYYEKTGTSSTDKFYVIATDSSDTTYGGIKYTTKYWGYYGQTTGATTDSIGSGKSNTNSILAISDTSSYSDSIFKWIKELRDSSYNGCSDWFIGSKTEQDQLRNSGKTSIYSAEYVWSSVEYFSDFACYWYYDSSYWSGYYKDYSFVGLALRAF